MMKNSLKTLCLAVVAMLAMIPAAYAQDLTVKLTSSLGGVTIVTQNTGPVHFKLEASVPSKLAININGLENIATADNATVLEADYTFVEPGRYNIYGNAEAPDGTKKSAQITLNYAFESPQKNFPGGVPKMGQTVNSDGSVTFCLGAPGKMSVSMVGPWSNYQVSSEYTMNYQDYNGNRYFWITIPDIDPTKAYPYYFRVDGNTSVGDPYAKLVLDYNNDKKISSSVYPDMPAYPAEVTDKNISLAVYQGNINDYNWTDSNFKHADKDNLIVYELLFRDFTGTEGRASGNGTVRKALEKLDYLQNLGVNVIELLPINEFNGNNSWGYNPNFYFAPDKAYGTPDDYKEFINECHNRGIAVVLDMVFNQCDWQHPWYIMYPQGSNPLNNGQNAPHAYSVLNDWNQGHPLVKQQWRDVVKYWMEEYHVDGYRFDLVKGLGDNSSYPNNSDGATNQFNQSRIDNMRDIQLAMLEVNPDAIFINENLAGSQEENKMAAFGQLNWANINNEGCQYAMGYNSNAGLNRMLATKDSRTWGSTVSYLESHDEERLAYKQNEYGASGVKGNLAVSMRRIGSAAAQMIFAPGSHMIWMFSELGNDQSTKSGNNNNVDPKKVLWSYYDVPDRRGLYDSYSELIHLRLGNPELFTEDCGFSLSFAGWTLGRYYHASANGKEIHLLINPQITGDLTMSTSFGSANQNDYYIASKSYGTEPSFNVGTGKVTVPPNSYVVIATNNVTSVEEITADMAASEVVGEAWYDLTGARVENPAHGLFIRVVKYADGTQRSFKQILR